MDRSRMYPTSDEQYSAAVVQWHRRGRKDPLVYMGLRVPDEILKRSGVLGVRIVDEQVLPVVPGKSPIPRVARAA